jgi:uncharacterized membrane protein
MDDDERLWNLLQIDQGRISALDSIAMTVQGWTVTLVSALVGFSFNEHNQRLLLAAALATILLGILDVRYRATQLLHARRVDRVEALLIPKFVLRPHASTGAGPIRAILSHPYRSVASFYSVVLILVAVVWITT